MPQQNPQFIESFKKDVKEITNDISDLMWDRKMYNEFVEIVTGNPQISSPNAFYDFVKTGYISHIILGICRQIDRNGKSLSLLNLLIKISNNPEKITKDWFASQYKNSVLGEAIGRSHFQEHFGLLDYIDPAMVQADIDNLILDTAEIKKYRDKRIAHVDKGNVILDKNFSFATLNKAIDSIERLGIKYYLLLHQGGITTLLPTDTTSDYRTIFYQPWIKK